MSNKKIKTLTFGTPYYTDKKYVESQLDKYRLAEGIIHIGEPPLGVGETLGKTEDGKRYTKTVPVLDDFV